MWQLYTYGGSRPLDDFRPRRTLPHCLSRLWMHMLAVLLRQQSGSRVLEGGADSADARRVVLPVDLTALLCLC